jgi:superoxide dismutase, Cu-Zn family
MLKMAMRALAASLFGATLSGSALAATATQVVIDVHLISAKGIGKSIGKIKASETKNGFLLLDFDLSDELPPGGHGLHIHENGDCGPGKSGGEMVAGLAAGGHFDPVKTGKHEGPSGKGHLGDLPILYVEVDEDGAKEVTHSLVAPRLHLADILGRSIVIHADSDNFSDSPKPLGGGGARIACGVIPKT